MKDKFIFLFLLATAILLTYCSKTKIIGAPPFACITTDKDTIHLKDSLVITNCSSAADNVYLNFYDGIYSASSYTFDKNNRFKKTFGTVGINYVIVHVWNNQSGSPIMEKKKTVVVLP